MKETDGAARRTAVVIGGGRGIGAASARALMHRGMNVGVTFRSALDPNMEAAAREGGGAFASAQLDVRDRGALTSALDRFAETLGGIDVLVYCVGRSNGDPILGLDEDSARDTFDTNYWPAC